MASLIYKIVYKGLKSDSTVRKLFEETKVPETPVNIGSERHLVPLESI